jgi:diguanylate cyclase (GGDEF)-like protein
VFIDMVNHAIATRQRREDFRFAVLFLDLDRFKTVNDSLGHHAGDALLKTAASQLKSVVRDMDTVARLGGDEFVILVEELESVEEVIYIATRITELMETPFIIEDQEVYIGTSIGIVFNDERYDSASTMLRDADTAMYRAKAAGKGRYEVFDASMQHQVLESLTLEADIRAGIDKGEFIPYFQPIFDLKTKTLVGFEALARWQSEKRGFVSPAQFISVAEDNGLINYIDMVIATQAAIHLKEWQELSGNKELYISTNLYCDQFFDSTLPSEIETLIKYTGLKPQCLRLELTERALLEKSDQVLTNMEALKELGVLLMLDDFGTGYSSLSYLYNFPLDILKIDRSFVANMVGQESSQAIVKTIIDLAKNLNMATVGEGIETIEESRRLTELDCDYGQGFYFARPMSAEDACGFLMAHLNKDEVNSL